MMTIWVWWHCFRTESCTNRVTPGKHDEYDDYRACLGDADERADLPRVATIVVGHFPQSKPPEET